MNKNIRQLFGLLVGIGVVGYSEVMIYFEGGSLLTILLGLIGGSLGGWNVSVLWMWRENLREERGLDAWREVLTVAKMNAGKEVKVEMRRYAPLRVGHVEFRPEKVVEDKDV